MLKQMLIPVAAFALTVTGASAFTGGDWSNLDIDLSSEQVSALEQAQEIRQSAREEADQVLESAGIDEEKMKEMHDAMRGAHEENREAVNTAIENNDYDAFITAIADTPMSETITTEAEFEKFAEAHQLMKDGDREGAKEIMSELGIEGKEGMRGEHGGGFGGPGPGEGRQSAESN